MRWPSPARQRRRGHQAEQFCCLESLALQGVDEVACGVGQLEHGRSGEHEGQAEEHPGVALANPCQFPEAAGQRPSLLFVDRPKLVERRDVLQPVEHVGAPRRHPAHERERTSRLGSVSVTSARRVREHDDAAGSGCGIGHRRV